MIENMLAHVICSTFEKEPGRNQDKKHPLIPSYIMRGAPKPQAMLVDLRINIDHEKEDGYRHIDLAIYAPMNYVAVFVRERWNVIPIEDLELDYDGITGDTYVKKGKSYNEGASEWKMLTYHDSCWRDAIQRTIFENRHRISGFGELFDWYKLIDASELPDPNKVRDEEMRARFNR